jgi:hypothetical protein
MKPYRAPTLAAVIAAVILFTPITGLAQFSRVADEPRYQGNALGHWLTIIRDRDEEKMSIAFEAIRTLGPEAAAAVPELTRIVAAPFSPIRIGHDSDEMIASKLYDLEFRSEAIDTLASIGEAASPATTVVIQWALTVRVVPDIRATRDDDIRFIDLVTLDAEYRVGVVAAVAAFGKPAVPALARLLKSSDIEKRKLAEMILGPDALEIAATLMKSTNCDDSQTALTIFGDLEPFVPKVYIAHLRRMLVCEAN